MKEKINFFLIFIFIMSLSLLSCNRPSYQQTANGEWIENENDNQFFPMYSSERTKKGIYLPTKVQQSIKDYYRSNGYWPLSENAYKNASPDNGFYLEALYHQGFSMLDFVSKGGDTLMLNFHFQTKGKINFDRDIALPVGRTLVGKFIFIAHPNGQITIDKKMEGAYKTR